MTKEWEYKEELGWTFGNEKSNNYKEIIKGWVN